MSESTDLAQRTVLGGVLNKPSRAGLAFALARVEDFDPPYSHVAQAIHALRVRQAAVTLVSVVDELTRRGTLSLVGGAAVVGEIAGHGFADDEVAYAAGIVAERARIRSLYRVSARVMQSIDQGVTDSIAAANRLKVEAQSVLDLAESASEDVATETLGEFLHGDDDPFDWVIPGLLERLDRMILTGIEGLGKSVLQRQIAVCAAAGLHPFTAELFEPQRVLYVDCENGRMKLRRHFRGLSLVARQMGLEPERNLFIEAMPEGLDLTTPEDEAWLVRRVAALQPSILFLGPLYRLHAKNPNDEEPARQVTRVVDRCRAIANCAVVLEGHAGHGERDSTHRPVRPTGTSLWLRWPEFGYGIRPNSDHTADARSVDLVAWRGDREVRDWPKRLVSYGPDPWPWGLPPKGLALNGLPYPASVPDDEHVTTLNGER